MAFNFNNFEVEKLLRQINNTDYVLVHKKTDPTNRYLLKKKKILTEDHQSLFLKQVQFEATFSDSPCIIQYKGYAYIDNCDSIGMKAKEGCILNEVFYETLEEEFLNLKKEKHPFPKQQVLGLMKNIATALDILKQKEILHQNINRQQIAVVCSVMGKQYKLTGFEYAINIIGANSMGVSLVNTSKECEYYNTQMYLKQFEITNSTVYNEDLCALGLICLECLDLSFEWKQVNKQNAETTIRKTIEKHFGQTKMAETFLKMIGFGSGISPREVKENVEYCLQEYPQDYQSSEKNKEKLQQILVSPQNNFALKKNLTDIPIKINISDQEDQKKKLENSLGFEMQQSQLLNEKDYQVRYQKTAPQQLQCVDNISEKKEEEEETKHINSLEEESSGDRFLHYSKDLQLENVQVFNLNLNLESQNNQFQNLKQARSQQIVPRIDFKMLNEILPTITSIPRGKMEEIQNLDEKLSLFQGQMQTFYYRKAKQHYLLKQITNIENSNIIDLFKKLEIVKDNEHILPIKGYIVEKNPKDQYWSNLYLIYEDKTENLQAILNYQQNYLNFYDKLKIAYQITKFLQFINSNQLIYGQLRTYQILLNKEKDVFITDFGINQLVMNAYDYAQAFSSQLSEYLDPPELQTEKELNLKSDIYSLGKLLYFIFFGKKLTEKIMTKYSPQKKQQNPLLNNILQKDHNNKYQLGQTKIRLVELIDKMIYAEAEKRISFLEIIDEFEKIFQQIQCTNRENFYAPKTATTSKANFSKIKNKKQQQSGPLMIQGQSFANGGFINSTNRTPSAQIKIANSKDKKKKANKNSQMQFYIQAGIKKQNM